MVEWYGIFRLFRFCGILGQPREVHPKFRNEIPENVCSIRSQTRNFRNFWSNGKRPLFLPTTKGGREERPWERGWARISARPAVGFRRDFSCRDYCFPARILVSFGAGSRRDFGRQDFCFSARILARLAVFILEMTLAGRRP